jgi:hypothetical protein
VLGLKLDGRDEADLAVQAVVEPVDVLGDRDLEVVDGTPQPLVADGFGLESPSRMAAAWRCLWVSDAEHWTVRIRVDGPSGTACRVTRKSYRRAGGGSGGGAQPRADKTLNVQNYIFAVSQVANTSLRSVIGHSDMDELLSTERERVNTRVLEIIDAAEGPWGVKIERVEVRDVSPPEAMKRYMSRQAEAERGRGARVITADSEF